MRGVTNSQAYNYTYSTDLQWGKYFIHLIVDGSNKRLMVRHRIDEFLQDQSLLFTHTGWMTFEGLHSSTYFPIQTRFPNQQQPSKSHLVFTFTVCQRLILRPCQSQASIAALRAANSQTWDKLTDEGQREQRVDRCEPFFAYRSHPKTQSKLRSNPEQRGKGSEETYVPCWWDRASHSSDLSDRSSPIPSGQTLTKC